MIKGKLLSSNFKVCCIDNLHNVNDETFLVLKEILTKEKISIMRSGVNCFLKIHSSLVASTKELEQLKLRGLDDQQIQNENSSRLENFNVEKSFKN